MCFEKGTIGRAGDVYRTERRSFEYVCKIEFGEKLAAAF